MTADRVALIDWDGSHVDVPDLDLVARADGAGVPRNAAGLDDSAHDIAAQAAAAWDAALAWETDNEHARMSLGAVRAV
jgi:hypothetical protein